MCLFVRGSECSKEGGSLTGCLTTLGGRRPANISFRISIPISTPPEAVSTATGLMRALFGFVRGGRQQLLATGAFALAKSISRSVLIL